MNIDERLIINCKQALFDARAYLDKAQMILDTMYADYAADDGKIDAEEQALIDAAPKSEESTGTSTNKQMVGEEPQICPLCKKACHPSKYYCADCNNEFES